MRVGSLFSGIGGLDLGLERAGMTVAWQSEIDPYACKVLARHWPHVPNLGDITLIDWSTVEHVDLVCGGYPCQPFSTAGRRGGADDARHLWPHFRDALRHLRPCYALLENVAGHVTLGLPDVLADLAALGFNAEWSIVPASWAGAPHRRDRIFILADADQPRSRYRCPEPARRNESRGSGAQYVANATQLLGDGSNHHGGGGGQSILTGTYLSKPRNGAGTWWAVEPDVGRVAHGIPSRVDRLRCLGNAVVPQIAEWIGRRIMQAAAA